MIYDNRNSTVDATISKIQKQNKKYKTIISVWEERKTATHTHKRECDKKNPSTRK